VCTVPGKYTVPNGNAGYKQLMIFLKYHYCVSELARLDLANKFREQLRMLRTAQLYSNVIELDEDALQSLIIVLEPASPLLP